jgi:hypothetical protein
VKYDHITDELFLRRTDKDNTFCRTTQTEYLKDMLSRWYAKFLKRINNRKILHDTARIWRTLKEPTRPLTSNDLLSASAEWEEAYSNEERGFKERGVFAIVKPPPGVKILGTTTVCD